MELYIVDKVTLQNGLAASNKFKHSPTVWPSNSTDMSVPKRNEKYK